MPATSRERAPQPQEKPDIHIVPNLDPEERARHEAEATRIHKKIEALRARTAEADAEKIAQLNAQLQEATWGVDTTVAQAQLNAAQWENEEPLPKPKEKE